VACELDGQDDDEGDDDMEEEEDDEEAGAHNVEDEEPVVDVSKGRIEGHTGEIYCVALHPSNANLIATGSGDDTGGLWDRATKQRIATLDGHTDTVVCVCT